MIRRHLFPIFTLFLLLSGSSLRAEDQFFNSNGVKLRFTVRGQGEPVLLIHGFTVDGDRQWGTIPTDLAKDYKVVAIDNRGHGKSEKPHDVKKYGMEMVEDAIRLLDHLQIKKAHVVGYSMGAMITNKLLTVHPDRLITATLGGAAGFREGSDSKLQDSIAESLEAGKGISGLIDFLTPPGQPKPSEEQLKAINAMVLANNDPLALAAVARGFSQFAISDEKLKANKVPTLALIGSDDTLKPGVDLIKPLLSGLTVVVIDGANHMTAPSRPEFIAELRKFLAAHKDAAK